MSQLTQQIAGAYIGAQVYWHGNTQFHVIDVIRSKYLYNMKLILTPLSHITDEGAVEVSKLFGHYQPSIEKGKALIDCFDDWGHWGTSDNETTLRNGQQITDYLRSRNYDLGYMGIRSLIDAGIAISSLDKTETDVQP